MNEEVAKALTKQLKIINFWITFFGTIIVILMLVTGFFVYKTVVFIKDTQTKIENTQNKMTETLNVKDDLCRNSLLSSSGYCKNR